MNGGERGKSARLVEEYLRASVSLHTWHTVFPAFMRAVCVRCTSVSVRLMFAELITIVNSFALELIIENVQTTSTDRRTQTH